MSSSQLVLYKRILRNISQHQTTADQAHRTGFFVCSENGLLCFAEQEMDQFDLIPYVLPPACFVALTVQGYFSLRRGRTSARQSRGSSTGCSLLCKVWDRFLCLVKWSNIGTQRNDRIAYPPLRLLCRAKQTNQHSKKKTCPVGLRICESSWNSA